MRDCTKFLGGKRMVHVTFLSDENKRLVLFTNTLLN